MEAITITKERIKQLLPQSVRESKELSNDAKTVLATLINYYVTLQICRDTGFVAIPNLTLCCACHFGKKGTNVKRMLTAIQELVETKLVKRIRGEKWKNDSKTASQYYINFDNFNKPIVKPTLDDLLREIEENKPEKFTTVSVPVIESNPVYVSMPVIESDSSTEVVSNTINQSPLKEKDNLSSSFVKESKTLKELEVKKTLEEQLKEWAKAVNSTGLKDEDFEF